MLLRTVIDRSWQGALRSHRSGACVCNLFTVRVAGISKEWVAMSQVFTCGGSGPPTHPVVASARANTETSSSLAGLPMREASDWTW
eukprot:5713013-Amphidinium_carterae.4